MTAKTVWIIDFIKALASQLIVWHHFVSYGPLIKTLRPYASGVVDWLFVDARMAVQAFRCRWLPCSPQPRSSS